MTAPLDPVVTRVLDSHFRPPNLSKSSPTTSPPSPTSSIDSDTLISALESDSTFTSAHRAARLQQLSTELARAASLRSESQHGVVTTVTAEKELMETVTKSPVALVHFFHPEFARCSIMDAQIEILAPLHYEAKFLRIDAREAPFLCGRIGIRLLPCLVGWVDGVEVERVVGFEGLGGNEQGFRIGVLERRLVEKGVLVREKMDDNVGIVQSSIRGEERNENEDDEDWD